MGNSSNDTFQKLCACSFTTVTTSNLALSQIINYVVVTRQLSSWAP